MNYICNNSREIVFNDVEMAKLTFEWIKDEMVLYGDVSIGKIIDYVNEGDGSYKPNYKNHFYGWDASEWPKYYENAINKQAKIVFPCPSHYLSLKLNAQLDTFSPHAENQKELTMKDIINVMCKNYHMKKGEAIKFLCDMTGRKEHELIKTRPDQILMKFYNSIENKEQLEKARKIYFVDKVNYILCTCANVSWPRYTVKDIIFNNPATIILWDDGTKTVAKCREGEAYCEEIGLMVCMYKRFIPGVDKIILNFMMKVGTSK